MSDPRRDFLTGKPLAPYYDAIALDPDRQYGIDPGLGNERGLAINTWLPFTTNRVGSASWVERGADPRWSVPQVLREGLKGWLDLLSSTDTGKLTPEALGAFLSGSIGAGAAAAPRGALAAGGKWIDSPTNATGSLPMDAASRLARARNLGFNVDRPFYHGTPVPEDFRAFATIHPWEAVRTGRAPGIWTAENPALAANFSIPELRERVGLVGLPGSPAFRESTPRILPLLARSENPASLTLSRGDKWGDINRTIADAFASGHDAVALHNYRMFPELGAQTIWSFRDPSQLRSRFAVFDPAKRKSSDLMAGFAAPGPTPVPGLHAWKPPEPASPGMISLPTGQVVDEAAIPNHLRPPGRQVY